MYTCIYVRLFKLTTIQLVRELRGHKGGVSYVLAPKGLMIDSIAELYHSDLNFLQSYSW